MNPTPGAASADDVLPFEQALDQNPADPEAARLWALAKVRRARKQVGLTDGEELPEKSDSWEPAADVATPTSPREPAPLAVIQQLESTISRRPHDPELYLELAQHYLDKEREYEAERLLTRGRDNCEKDPKIVHMLEDVMLLRMGKKVAAAQLEYQNSQTPATKDALEQVLKERDRVGTEVFQARCKRAPNDLRLRFDLGLRLKRTGKVYEARKCFEEALREPAVRALAAFELADNHEQNRDIAEALRHFRAAADSALGREQAECKRKALLRAGKLAAQAKLTRLAKRYFNRLLRFDPTVSAAKAELEALDAPAKSTPQTTEL